MSRIRKTIHSLSYATVLSLLLLQLVVPVYAASWPTYSSGRVGTDPSPPNYNFGAYFLSGHEYALAGYSQPGYYGQAWAYLFGNIHLLAGSVTYSVDSSTLKGNLTVYSGGTRAKVQAILFLTKVSCDCIVTGSDVLLYSNEITSGTTFVNTNPEGLKSMTISETGDYQVTVYLQANAVTNAYADFYNTVGGTQYGWTFIQASASQ